MCLEFYVSLALSAALAWIVWQNRRAISNALAIARRWEAADFSALLPAADSNPLATLAHSINNSVRTLRAQSSTSTTRQQEVESVLATLEEGILVIDPEEQLTFINQAAAKVLDVNTSGIRYLEEVVRSADLLGCIRRSLKTGEPCDCEVTLHGERERAVRSYMRILRGKQHALAGVLVVLTDVTRMRQLENVRREFAANVSHELKTPLTSLKGFVETLRDGAIDNPQDARKFLQIIEKQILRLEELVTDTLNLSRLEQDNERGEIELESEDIFRVLSSACELCSPRARERDIKIEVSCPAALRAEINSNLLEQAVVNLVDNAIKYSNPGSTIRLQARSSETGISIEVHDSGSGIAQEHLPRIFERFYRIDKARSRKLGGTGLGLAIVKHIAEAHGGYASVESTLGKGSTFALHLPTHNLTRS